MSQFVTPLDSASWIADAQKTLEQLLERSLSDELLLAFGQDVSDAFVEAIQAWQEEPDKLREILDQWSATLEQQLESVAGTKFDQAPATSERLLQTYSAIYQELAVCLYRLVDEAPDIESRKRNLLRFVARQIVSACAPENWPNTNPKVIEKALTSKGDSLAQGLELLREDISNSKVGVKVRTAGKDDYVLGETVATTAGEVIHETPLYQLIQYYPASQKVRQEPILLVPPCINKFYILDLTPANSLVQWLVRQGYTVFMISWVNPEKPSQAFSYSSYVRDGCIDAMRQVRALCDEMPIHLVGYCISGSFAGCAAAQLADKKKEWLKSLTLLNTLLDYSRPGEIEIFVSDRLSDAIQRFVEESGVIEGEVLAQAFSFLREDRMIWPFVVNSYLLGKPPKPNALLYWNQDSTNVSAGMLNEYLRSMYRKNALAGTEPYRNEGLSVDLSKIDVPVFVLGSKRDHIVPWQGGYKSAQLLSSEVCFVLACGGHVSAVAHSPNSSRLEYWSGGKVCSTKTPEQWYDEAENTAGSWWIRWQEWMESIGELDRRRPRFPGDGSLSPIEPAPGRYVKVSSCATAQIDPNSAQ